MVVTDAHNGEVSQEIDLFVWNSAVATATTGSGVEVQYSLDYNGQSEFTIDTLADKDASGYDAVQLEGFTGTYAAVAAMDYAPSTTYTASDVLDQSISVIVGKDVEATSLWYIDGSGKWVLLSDASTDVDATTEMFTYDVPDNTPVVPAGVMVLMGGELAQASIPDASVSGFSAEATRGGAIAMNWDITGTLLNSDSIVVSICAAEADCDDAFEATVADEDRTTPTAVPKPRTVRPTTSRSLSATNKVVPPWNRQRCGRQEGRRRCRRHQPRCWSSRRPVGHHLGNHRRRKRRRHVARLLVHR